jgi:hypothetical protein
MYYFENGREESFFDLEIYHRVHLYKMNADGIKLKKAPLMPNTISIGS